MLQLLKIEWLKVKNYRTFWILAALYLLSIFGANLIGYNIQEKIYSSKEAGNMADMILGGRPYSFPKVWQMTSSATSFILFIAGLLMIILVTNEYSFKTHRQNIIDGLTRTQFIVTKFVCGIIIALASTLIVFLTALFFGLIFKRSGIAIGIFFLYTLIIENVITIIFNHVVPDSFFLNGIGNFLPIQSTDELLPIPAFEKVQQQLNVPEVNTMLQLAFVAGYLCLFFFISKRKFETDDL